MEYRTDNFSPDEVIDIAKQAIGITKPNDEMTDEEIGAACKWPAVKAPDTIWADDKPVFGRMGIGVMLFLAITEFPEFYMRHELSQVN